MGCLREAKTLKIGRDQELEEAAFPIAITKYFRVYHNATVVAKQSVNVLIDTERLWSSHLVIV